MANDVTTNFGWTIPLERDEDWYQEFIDLMNEIDIELYNTQTASGKLDHGNLLGLADDDHLQYLNSTRHDAHDHSAALASAILNDLGDLEVSNPSDGNFIVWSESTSKWIFGGILNEHSALGGLGADDHPQYFGGTSATSAFSAVIGRLGEQLIVRGTLSVSCVSSSDYAIRTYSGSVRFGDTVWIQPTDKNAKLFISGSAPWIVLDDSDDSTRGWIRFTKNPTYNRYIMELGINSTAWDDIVQLNSEQVWLSGPAILHLGPNSGTDQEIRFSNSNASLMYDFSVPMFKFSSSLRVNSYFITKEAASMMSDLTLDGSVLGDLQITGGLYVAASQIFNVGLDTRGNTGYFKIERNAQYPVYASVPINSAHVNSNAAGIYASMHSDIAGTGNMYGGKFRSSVVGTEAKTGNLYGIHATCESNEASASSGYGGFFKINTVATGKFGACYGLYVDDIPTADSRYAIYTKAGSVRFGDVVIMASGMVLSGSVIGDLHVGGTIYTPGSTYAGHVVRTEELFLTPKGIAIGDYLPPYYHSSGKYGIYLNRKTPYGDPTTALYIDWYQQGDADDGTVRGAWINVGASATGISALAGAQVVSTIKDGFSVNTLYGMYSQLTVHGSATNAYSFYSYIGGAGSVPNDAVHFYGTTIYRGTNRYGMYLNDITDGTINYAIYTKAGSVRFGDVVIADGGFDEVDILSDHVNISTSKTPSGSGDTGAQGDIAWDANYVYVCTAASTWGRAALDFGF